jgi:uncharacterized protein (TIGR03435 family)
MSLQELIAEAYQVKPDQVTGPEWLGGTRFDVLATLPPGSTTADAYRMLQTLLAERFRLAVDRQTAMEPAWAFTLGKKRPNWKEAAASAAEDTPLKPGEVDLDTPAGHVRMASNGAGGRFIMGKNGLVNFRTDTDQMVMYLEGTKVTTAGLAELLTHLSRTGGGDGRRVIDETGLAGAYDFALNLRVPQSSGSPSAQDPENGGLPVASDPTRSVVLQAVGELGLQWKASEAPVERIVVDHVDKVPTAN